MAAVLSVLVSLGPSTAHGAPGDGGPGGGFEIYLCGDPAIKDTVRHDLHELLSRERLMVRLQDVSSIDPIRIAQQDLATAQSRGGVWLDLAATTRDRATIYIRDRTPSRMIVRTVMLPTGWDEVAREEISHIVAASLDALASGAPLDGPAAAQPAPAEQAAHPEQAAHAAPAARVVAARPPLMAAVGRDESSMREAQTTSFSLGSSGAISASPTGHSVGAALGLSSLVRLPRLHPRGALWIDLAYSMAGSTETSVMDLKLMGGSLAVVSLVSLADGAWVNLRAGLGGAVTVMAATPRPASEAIGVEAGPSDVAWEGAVRAAVRVDVTWRALRAFLAPACDLAFPRYRYVVAGDAKRETVAETVPWRPSLWLGLEFERRPSP